jgi:hypothetical protein
MIRVLLEPAQVERLRPFAASRSISRPSGLMSATSARLPAHGREPPADASL